MRARMRLLLPLAIVLSAASCARDDYAHLYRPQPIAPGFTQQEVSDLQHLGATRLTTGVNFSVYSAHATRVDLLVFDDPESNHPAREFQMSRFGDVWNLFVEGVGLGTYYGYVAWGPNWPYVPTWKPGTIDGFLADVDAEGNRFNPNKLLLDPYARAFHRDHDWSKGSLASGPKRTELTWAAAAKSVVVQSGYGWSSNESSWREMRKSATPPVGHRQQDLIVYEVHPKGFTADAASGVAHPGTYRGVGEKADYFKNLGINAVELMPVFEKPVDGGYWGYQTIGFFAPELTYSSDRRPGMPIDEFKWMVDQLHQQGVEVILDVVYNHTGEGGLWRDKVQQDVSADPISNLGNFDPKEIAGLYSYRGLDNSSYYALLPDPGFYVNDTGVGDMTRCNNTPMRRLILDSLHYWVEEMHVDGFRFDLAPILAETDLKYQTFDAANTMLQTIADDPVLQAFDTRVIAEPWSLVSSYLGQFPASKTRGGAGWYEWNGGFRDWWREFVNFDTTTLKGATEYGKDGGYYMTGSYDWFHGSQRRPYHSVNFITVHDGFTLYDLESYDHQRNGCGPLNPVCCDSPASPFCDPLSGTTDNRSRNWTDETFKRQQIRNLLTGMMIAPGTPMLLGGDEWMRTQLGNNNAYTTGADNPFNWFDWGAWEASPDRVRMHAFTVQLLRFRREHAYAFADADYPVNAYPKWVDISGAAATDANSWYTKRIAQDYDDATRGPRLYVMINMETDKRDFVLPAGVTWKRLLDTQAFFETSGNFTLDSPAVMPAAPYGVVGHSIVILQAAQ